jgi:tetratricopeptide (TPR) repeat protein
MRRMEDMMQRPIFLSGKVVMDDGTPPPEPVSIERVCNGVARTEQYTDSKGRFNFQLGQNQGVFQDASQSSSDGLGGGGLGGGMPGQRMPGMGGIGGMGAGISERDLVGCEIRASLPGFQSSVVQLAGRRSLDNPDLGTIILRRLAKVDGFTFSATTGMAPKDARKAFEKGMQAGKKKKWSDAEKELMKAVTTYDRFAVAWYELGTVYQAQGKFEEARNSYQAAIKADSKLVTPYAQLTRLAASEKKWGEAADWSAKLIKLNPYFSPEVYFMSGVANLNLNKLPEAEEHTREALKMDTQHRNPKAHHLLGIILAQKKDYQGATENVKLYLKYAPNAADAPQVRQQLAELESAMGGGTTAAAQPQENK